VPGLIQGAPPKLRGRLAKVFAGRRREACRHSGPELPIVPILMDLMMAGPQPETAGQPGAHDDGTDAPPGRRTQTGHGRRVLHWPQGGRTADQAIADGPAGGRATRPRPGWGAAARLTIGAQPRARRARRSRSPATPGRAPRSLGGEAQERQPVKAMGFGCSAGRRGA